MHRKLLYFYLHSCRRIQEYFGSRHSTVYSVQCTRYSSFVGFFPICISLSLPSLYLSFSISLLFKFCLHYYLIFPACHICNIPTTKCCMSCHLVGFSIRRMNVLSFTSGALFVLVLLLFLLFFYFFPLFV